MSSRSTLPDPFFQQRCQHVYADGRRCTLFRMGRNCTLCFQHWSVQREKENSQWAADDILSYVRDLDTVEEINDVLGRLFRHVAYNRIPQRKAGLLVYICQLLLSTVPHLQDETMHEQAAYDAAMQPDLPTEAVLPSEDPLSSAPDVSPGQSVPAPSPDRQEGSSASSQPQEPGSQDTQSVPNITIANY